MRLIDLDPRWFVLESGGPRGGPRVGLSFLCPHCHVQRIAVAFHHRGHEAIDDSYIRAHHGGSVEDRIWNLESAEDFAVLTLTPSIDASKSGHWHGFITNGEIR